MQFDYKSPNATDSYEEGFSTKMLSRKILLMYKRLFWIFYSITYVNTITIIVLASSLGSYWPPDA